MSATAKSRWQRLDTNRSVTLSRARQCADLTIPALLPPEGSDQNARFPTPYQSLGARGVNNLASKLLLALLPPSGSFFRFGLDPEVSGAMDPDVRGDVEKRLSELEAALMRRIEGSNLRAMLHAAIKHLIVTGNALLHIPRDAPARVFRMTQFVVQRDAAGTVTEAVLKESVSPLTLSPDVLAAVGVAGKDMEKDVEVYTRVELESGGGFVRWYSEINEKRVPDSEGRVPVAESPFIVLRWQAVENEDYGRGLVEEYLGDLISLEGLSKAIVQFSAAAAKILLIRKPNATVDEDELIDAESGQVITGMPEDITVLQLEKFADFQVAKGVLDDLTLRLSHAFLLQSGTVRDAERVTAEEIRAMAQELEDVLGGTYTVLSQELQLPLVRRLMAVMRTNGKFPTLTEDVEPIIVTGFDALGRGHELNRLRAFYADLVSMIGPEAAIGEFSPTRLARKLSTAHNVDVADVLLTDEEKGQRQNAQMQQTLMEKATGPVAGAVAKGMTNGEG